jgi:psiF repeat
LIQQHCIGFFATYYISNKSLNKYQKGYPMNKIALLLLITLPLAFGTAMAEEKKASAQNNKMKTCNVEAKEKELKGTDRKAFMKECLKKKTT